ncbi:MAG: ThiF family adenylyltransferase, partial [Hyphomicrobium sp.]
DLELAINTEPRRTSPITLAATVDAKGMIISGPAGYAVASDHTVPHDLAAKLAACYAAGVVIAHAVGGPRLDRLALPFAVNFSALGVTEELLEQLVVLENTVLAGAGGVASGFLWALESIDVRGELDVADPKAVSTGNLNRCFHFTKADVGQSKAKSLCANANLPNLGLYPFVGTFKDLRRQRGRIKRVIVTVDSRPARRAIQSELPLEVLDASTTDVSEVVVHSHAQPNAGACLSCIYHHTPLEDERMRSMAEGLGVAYDEIAGKEFIDSALAARLAGQHGLDAAQIEGVAVTSLYKELCAAEALKSAAGEQALAPFAFVSNLAGVLLAIELLRFEAARAGARAASYQTLDPWSPPHTRSRRSRSKLAGCEFCSDADSLSIMATIWPEWFANADGEAQV